MVNKGPGEDCVQRRLKALPEGHYEGWLSVGVRLWTPRRGECMGGGESRCGFCCRTYSTFLRETFWLGRVAETVM